MKKGFLFIVGGLIGFFGFGQAPSGYYDSAAGLDGDDLREALHQIIKGHTSKSYDNLWDYFDDTDSKSNGKIWDMYSVNEYTFSSDQCGNYSQEGDCYNREHSFPKSWYNDASPMNSDLFHVYPTDGWVNGKRSNLPYGEVSSASWTGSNGSKVGSSSVGGFSGNVFEPRDEYKGDFARTYFYMMTRYKDVASGWSSDMLSGNDLATWAKDMLMDWHKTDTVSQKEIDRNNAIYRIQSNRNPYIDNPIYANYVWGDESPEPGTQSINQKLEGIKLYYVEGILNLEIKNTAVEELRIFSVIGNEVFTKKLNSKTNTLNLNLTTGTYIAVLDGVGVKFFVD